LGFFLPKILKAMFGETIHFRSVINI